MKYYSATHQPVPWQTPSFVDLVSAQPVGDPHVLALADRFAPLSRTGYALGEYGALFSVRRLLEEESARGEGGEFVGIGHWRRYAVTRPVGQRAGFYSLVSPEEFTAEAPSLLIPRPGQVVAPHPCDLGRSVLDDYAENHHLEDLLQFFAVAVEMRVVESRDAAQFLAGTTMVPAASIGVYPTEWMIQVLAALEAVSRGFLSQHSGPREGYQSRLVAFCCERLQSLLLLDLFRHWSPDLLELHPAVVISEDGSYTTTT